MLTSKSKLMVSGNITASLESNGAILFLKKLQEFGATWLTPLFLLVVFRQTCLS